jgi:hypothetical protein
MASGLPSNPLKKIQLVRIAHVWYKHADIEKAKQFALDFGFVETAQIGKTTFYRGYGTEPFALAAEASDKDEFGGAAFVVESEEDLVHASKTLPKECMATEVHEMKDVPGGGKRVTFYDPIDGFPFHLVYGQTPVAREDPGFPATRYNYVSFIRHRCLRASSLTLRSPSRRTVASTNSSAFRNGRRQCTSSATLACA